MGVLFLWGILIMKSPTICSLSIYLYLYIYIYILGPLLIFETPILRPLCIMFLPCAARVKTSGIQHGPQLPLKRSEKPSNIETIRLLMDVRLRGAANVCSLHRKRCASEELREIRSHFVPLAYRWTLYTQLLVFLQHQDIRPHNCTLGPKEGYIQGP